MAITNLSPPFRQRFFDTNGLPLAGGKLFSYQAGTTTPQATYIDNSGVTPNANPVILSASGEADVWLDPSFSYKFVLKDSLDVLQWTVDNVVGTLTNDAVATDTIQDLAVTTAKLADGAVTQAKLAAESFGPLPILNFSLQAAVAANEMVITLRDGTGGAPASSSPVKIPFRNATAATGTPVYRSVTSAISVTVSSGSTLGSVNAQPNWIYVYAMDNAGTVELAVSASKMWDEGSLQTATADGGGGSADSKVVLYSNNGATSKPIRLLGRVKSTQATAGTWVTAPSELSLSPFEQKAPRSEVWLYTGNGYGSTNTPIRRWTTVGKNVGTAITYADSATNGASFTVNEDGLYSVSYSDNFNGASSMGISLNSTQLTSTIGAINQSDVAFAVTASNANVSSSCGGVLALVSGDIIRCHADAAPQGASTSLMVFRMTKVSD